MNWIRIAVGIGRDPSMIAMSRALGVSTPLTTGCCVLVFVELPTVSRGGDLSGVSDDAIEAWAQWSGKRGKFAEAFRTYMCTPQGVVRSWEKHNGAAIREADRRAESMRERRKKPARDGHVTGNAGVTVTVTPALTGRDGTGRSTKQQQIAPIVADAPTAPALVLESEASPKGPKYPHFPMPLCREMHALWVSRFGACDVARFRREFGPLFTISESERPAEAPTNGELRDALKSYADLAPMGAGARFANVKHAAGCLAAIAVTRRELSEAPDRRSDAVMRIIHGRMSA